MIVPPDKFASGTQAANTAPLRLFFGIACPCTEVIAGLLDELHNTPECAAGLRIVAPHNLHITLKFIGAAAATVLPDIVSAMQQALVDQHAFALRLRGAGRFKPALWLGVEPNAALGALASRLNEAMVPLGFAPEPRPYQPHLTLARLTSKPLSVHIERWIAQHRTGEWGDLPVTAVHLYRSDTLPDGVRYTVLSTVSLRSPST